MENPALLVATIGNRDPETESGPLGPMRAVLELAPQRVLLLSLAGVRANAVATLERIREVSPATAAEILEIGAADPVNIVELIHAVDRAVSGELHSVDGAVAVCTTSGTPQFSLATTLVTLARAPGATHYQALDPSKAAPPLLRPYDPDVLRHTAETEQAFRAMERCQFAEAHLLLERRLKGPAPVGDAAKALRTARRISEAMMWADALHPEKANRVLGSTDQGTVPDLEKWYAALSKEKKSNHDWPVEIGALAFRQRQADLLTAPLLSAATSMEVALSVRLRTRHHLDPEKVTLEDRERLPDHIKQRLRQVQSIWKLEGAENLSELLCAWDTAYSHFVAAREEERGKLRDARNRLIHAGRAPDRAAVDGCLKFLDDLCDTFGWRRPSECPSSPGAIAALVVALRPRAGLAPMQ